VLAAVLDIRASVLYIESALVISAVLLDIRAPLIVVRATVLDVRTALVVIVAVIVVTNVGCGYTSYNTQL
jgi:hypothetical protein